MYRNFKIKFYIPAGRKRYMELLIPQLVREDVCDEIIVLKNTLDPDDGEYIDALPTIDSRFKIYHIPAQLEQYIGKSCILISAFYKYMCDPDTIYIKFDDDLIYIQEGSIKNILDARIDNPGYFIVSPLVVNNAYCMWRLAKNGRVAIPEIPNMESYGGIESDYLFHDGKLCEKIHDWFVDEIMGHGKVDEIKIKDEEMSNSRISINCICWFGCDMAKAAPYVTIGDDEEFISRTWANHIKAKNMLVGSGVTSHFAFGDQRKSMDEARILEKYRNIL